MTSSIITNDATNTTTPTSTDDTPAPQPDAANPKTPFNANAARKHKRTGASISLTKGAEGWVAFCETHQQTSDAAPTRNGAEAFRINPSFCAECAAKLDTPVVNVAATPDKTPATEQPKPKSSRKSKSTK